MQNRRWKKWLLTMCSGALMLQTAGCVEAAAVATSVFTAVTAGGVLFLVNRVVND